MEACRKAQAEAGGVVEPANYNSPQQTVISGQEAGVERAMALAKEAGAEKVVRLQVGAPFHCSLMSALQEEFAATLERYSFRDPAIPVVANVTGDYVRRAAAVKDALRRQVAGAVRWTDSSTGSPRTASTPSSRWAPGGRSSGWPPDPAGDRGPQHRGRSASTRAHPAQALAPRPQRRPLPGDA